MSHEWYVRGLYGVLINLGLPLRDEWLAGKSSRGERKDIRNRLIGGLEIVKVSFGEAMDAKISEVMDRTLRPLQWVNNVVTAFGYIAPAATAVLAAAYDPRWTSLAVLIVTAAILWRVSAKEFVDSVLDSLKSVAVYKVGQKKTKKTTPLQEFRDRHLCSSYKQTADGRFVTHVGKSLFSATYPNGVNTKVDGRVLAFCNRCGATGETVRLADGRFGLLHREMGEGDLVEVRRF